MLPRHGNIWTVWGAEIFWREEHHRSNETNLRNPRYPPTNSKLQLKETRSLIFGVWLSYISSQCNVVHKSRMIVRTKYNQGICPAAQRQKDSVKNLTTVPWGDHFQQSGNKEVLLEKYWRSTQCSMNKGRDPRKKTSFLLGIPQKYNIYNKVHSKYRCEVHLVGYDA